MQMKIWLLLPLSNLPECRWPFSSIGWVSQRWWRFGRVWAWKWWVNSGSSVFFFFLLKTTADLPRVMLCLFSLWYKTLGYRSGLCMQLWQAKHVASNLFCYCFFLSSRLPGSSALRSIKCSAMCYYLAFAQLLHQSSARALTRRDSSIVETQLVLLNTQL